MDIPELSEPARKLLLDMADGKVLTYTRAESSGLTGLGRWELDGEYLDDSKGPDELLEQGLIDDLTFSAPKTPVSLTPKGLEVARQLRASG